MMFLKKTGAKRPGSNGKQNYDYVICWAHSENPNSEVSGRCGWRMR